MSIDMTIIGAFVATLVLHLIAMWWCGVKAPRWAQEEERQGEKEEGAVK